MNLDEYYRCLCLICAFHNLRGWQYIYRTLVSESQSDSSMFDQYSTDKLQNPNFKTAGPFTFTYAKNTGFRMTLLKYCSIALFIAVLKLGF